MVEAAPTDLRLVRRVVLLTARRRIYTVAAANGCPRSSHLADGMLVAHRSADAGDVSIVAAAVLAAMLRGAELGWAMGGDVGQGLLEIALRRGDRIAVKADRDATLCCYRGLPVRRREPGDAVRVGAPMLRLA